MSVPDGRLAPMRTPIGSPPAKATMQLLHQTCTSRIDRLNAAASIGGSAGCCGAQHRFNASTSSPMSSVLQNLYALNPGTYRRERAIASEPPERSEAAKRRASDGVGESEGRSPSDQLMLAHGDRRDLVEVRTAG